MGTEATFGDAFDNARTVTHSPFSRRITDTGVPHVVQFDTTPSEPSVPADPEEEDLQYLFDSSHELICISTVEGYFSKVNPAFSKTLGWTNRQLRSKPFLEFVHPDDRDRTLASMEALRHGQPVRRFENRYLSSEGQYRLLSWNAFPKDGKIYAVARDVTLSPSSLDLQRQIQAGLTEWFEGQDGGSGSSFSDATKKAQKGVTWLKWALAVVVTVFGAGVGYQQFFTDNATKDDLKDHVKNDLEPVQSTLEGVKVSVDSLVASEKRQAERAQKEAELAKKLRRLEAYRAEYQESLAEYTATKAAGKRATRPRKTQAHMDLEAELSAPAL